MILFVLKMKQPVFLKAVDLLAQLLALALPWVYFMLTLQKNEYIHLEHFIMSCFIIGGCQLVSYFINRFFFPKKYYATSRHWYELALLLIVAMIVIAVVMKALALAVILLVYISPVIVFWYFGITVAELIKVWKQYSL